jgi:hypothetical protein
MSAIADMRDVPTNDLSAAVHDADRRTSMSLQISDIAPDFEAIRDSDTLTDLFQIVARATACSPLVFAGLLAWSSMNARRAPKRDGGHTSRSISALIHSSYAVNG